MEGLTIIRLTTGESKFIVGEKGVKNIEVTMQPLPMFAVHMGDGTIIAGIINDRTQWTLKQPAITVPKIVPPSEIANAS